MTDDEDHGEEEHADDGEERPYETERTTAPQSDYTGSDVALGALVALFGMIVVFAVPLLLA